MIVKNADKVIADQVQPANSFFSRLIGLMGKRGLKEREGLLLFRCSCIHCLFMRFPIDAVYLSKDLQVLGIETVKPWSLGHYCRGTKHVLELSENEAAGKIAFGDRLSLNDP